MPKHVVVKEDYTVLYVVRAFSWFSKRKHSVRFKAARESNGCKL